MAEYLPWWPVKTILFGGRLAPLGLVAAYTIFVAIWLPFKLLSMIITEWGVYALLIGTVAFIGRFIVR